MSVLMGLCDCSRKTPGGLAMPGRYTRLTDRTRSLKKQITGHERTQTPERPICAYQVASYPLLSLVSASLALPRPIPPFSHSSASLASLAKADGALCIKDSILLPVATHSSPHSPNLSLASSGRRHQASESLWHHSGHLKEHHERNLASQEAYDDRQRSYADLNPLLTQSVDHPNIVLYMDSLKTEESLFIVLECALWDSLCVDCRPHADRYVENGSLSDITKEVGRFPEPLIVIYISQVRCTHLSLLGEGHDSIIVGCFSFAHSLSYREGT